MTNKQIEIFQSEDGQAQVEVHFEQDTVWLSQTQMVDLFDKNKRTVSEHIRNIFKEGELQEEPVVRADDGKSYNVNHYNLDVVISVGYRVKSQRGTQFRIWATQRLREYLTKGYTLNQQRFEQNAKELEAALTLIKKAAKSPTIIAEATIRKFRIVREEGNRQVNREIQVKLEKDTVWLSQVPMIALLEQDRSVLSRHI